MLTTVIVLVILCDDVHRMYEIETLAKGLNKELAGGATAKTGTRAH